jgi:ethanolamine permease
VTGIHAVEHPELRHLVTQSATHVENALLLRQPHALLLRLNWPGNTLGSDADGLLCLDEDGRLLGCNSVARQMLPDLMAPSASTLTIGDVFGTPVDPLFDAARLSGSNALVWLLGIGTLFATLASANGCINDASRAWFAMGRDKYLPGWFGAVHPKYRTPYRSIVFLVPIALAFALKAPLDQVVTFSILSGLLEYTFMPLNVILFRKKWPLDTIKRGYVHPFHPIPALVLLALCSVTYFAVFLGYGTQLVAMVAFYIVVSLWFHFYRYRYVKRGDQFTMPWPKPLGY